MRDLEDALSHTKYALEEVTKQSTRGLGAIRRQLSPLYLALQDVFGELDKAGVQDTGATQSSGSQDARISAVWGSWKSKFPGAGSKVIDALLLHGEMNTQQIAIAIGCHRNSVPQLIFKLNKAGLLNKNGGKFSLKPL